MIEQIKMKTLCQKIYLIIYFKLKYPFLPSPTTNAQKLPLYAGLSLPNTQCSLFFFSRKIPGSRLHPLSSLQLNHIYCLLKPFWHLQENSFQPPEPNTRLWQQSFHDLLGQTPTAQPDYHANREEWGIYIFIGPHYPTTRTWGICPSIIFFCPETGLRWSEHSYQKRKNWRTDWQWSFFQPVHFQLKQPSTQSLLIQ